MNPPGSCRTSFTCASWSGASAARRAEPEERPLHGEEDVRLVGVLRLEDEAALRPARDGDAVRPRADVRPRLRAHAVEPRPGGPAVEADRELRAGVDRLRGLPAVGIGALLEHV